MRAIENTITAYPGQSPEGVLDKRWVYAGHTVFAAINTDDSDAIQTIGHVLTDLFKPDEIGIVAAEGSAVLTLRSRYTTNYDVVNAALAQAAEALHILPVYWVANTGQFSVRLQVPEEAI